MRAATGLVFLVGICVSSAADASPPIEVTSFVDRSCLSDLNFKIEGRLPQEDAAAWAEACRNVTIDKRCTVTSSVEDSACVSDLELKISGRFTEGTEQTVGAACRQVTATCKVKKRPTETTSAVAASCVSELFLAHSGRPDWDTALSWLDRCRSQPSKKCMAIGGGPDRSCMSDLNTKADGKPSSAQAVTLAQKCRRIELRCPS